MPKELEANLSWRYDVLRAAAKDKGLQQQLWRMSCRDLLFFINAFCWTYSPKDSSEFPELPMITWEFQDPKMLAFQEAIGNHDLHVEKSRDVGVSWMALFAFYWFWLTKRGQKFLLISRVEDLVDSTDDPDALMPKLDFVQKNLPTWMQPATERNRLKMVNEWTGSVITGTSTTGQSGRAGRATAVLLDEFAAVPDGFAILRAIRDVTNCVIDVSTPQGTGNAFHNRSEKLRPEWKIRIHWSEHPIKGAGLYTTEDGRPNTPVKILDEGYEFPPGYPFIRDGKVRSPWYDLQCERAANDQEIAQELDIDFLGSGWQFFKGDLLNLLRLRTRPPLLRGDLLASGGESAESIKPKFLVQEEGYWKLWVMLDGDGKPAVRNPCVVACDICTGKGGKMSSNSTISIGDAATGQKLAEYKCNSIDPPDFARLAIAACKWFNEAFLIWEANGPGGQFGKHVMKLGYRKVYYRRNEKKELSEDTDEPGWWSTVETKRLLLGEYAAALKEGRIENPSLEAIEEAGQYVQNPNGSVSHSRSLKSPDPNEVGDSHGDIVIADALLYRGIGRAPKPTAEEHEERPPGSYLDRRMAYEEKLAASRSPGHW